jgi:hypothetical protein
MDFTSLALKVIQLMPKLPAATYDLPKVPYKHPYEFYKEKEAFESEKQMHYDKVRWPMHKELIMKRTHLAMLPSIPKNVQKLIGLKDIPIVPTSS